MAEIPSFNKGFEPLAEAVGPVVDYTLGTVVPGVREDEHTYIRNSVASSQNVTPPLATEMGPTGTDA